MISYPRGNAQWRLRAAHYQQHSIVVMCSVDRVPLIVGKVQRSATKIFASLCLLSLPCLPANSTGTTGPARILRISPRLPPCQPRHHLSRSKCGGLPPRLLSVFSLLHSSPSVGVTQSKPGCVCLISQGEAVACMSCRGANCSDFLG